MAENEKVESLNDAYNLNEIRVAFFRALHTKGNEWQDNNFARSCSNGVYAFCVSWVSIRVAKRADYALFSGKSFVAAWKYGN